MGQGHLAWFVKYPDVQVLAVCDVDRWRRENAQHTVAQAYGQARESGVYRGCAAYRDLRQLLGRQDIDAVVIATGDNWHATATVLAAESGKDVYCEKPASLTIYEAQAMIRAIRRYGRVFQTGLQQRSAAEFRLACSLVQKGALGRVRQVYVNFPGTSSDVDLPAEPVPEGLDWDLWLGPAPWRPYNSRFHPYGPPKGVVPWHFCRDFGGGNLTSNAVHAFDVVQWGLGMDHSGPVEIIPPETGEVAYLTYRYADGTELQVTPKLDPNHHDIPPDWDPNTTIQHFGALFVGEDGWIHVGRQGFLQAYPPDLIETYLARYEHAVALGNHHRDWLEAIRTRRRPASDVETGCRSTIVSHLGCIAHWTGRKLRWNPVREEFLDDAEANRLRRRAMRPPWQV
jgi:predicted dehydrogenase